MSNAPNSTPAVEPHPAIAPLSFLLGTWEGAGVVGYPTMESVNFGEETSFSHNGKPFLIYSSRTWLIEPGRDDRAAAARRGRLLATAAGQPGRGAADACDRRSRRSTSGQIDGTKIEIITDAVVRTATAKEVTAGKRLYGLIGSRSWLCL